MARSLAPWWCLLLLIPIGCRRHAPRQHAVQTQSAASGSTRALEMPSAVASCAPATAVRTALARREACEFKKGDFAQKTLAPDEPIGPRIPIDTFVIVMQENRSFDQYFQQLPKFGQPDVAVAPAGFRNEDSLTKREVEMFHQTALCDKDVRHDWNSAHRQFNDGKMDGFVDTSNPRGSRAVGYYDATELKYYYTLANTFAIGDHYFASVLGPTWPNRMFFHSGTTLGHIGNVVPPEFPEEQSLFHQLSKVGIQWAVYAQGTTFEEKIFPHLRAINGDRFKDFEQFFADAEQGTLPAYVWLESSHGGPDATDEHPPADVQLGQRLVARVIDTLMKSPLWAHSALFLMYDEPGGFFDHVPPPPACPPDEVEPLLEPRHVRARFDRLGMRTPFIVVSPFAKAHYVSHQVFSHSSVARMVQARFGLPALSARDANASVPYDLFDFARPPFSNPPNLPGALVDEQTHEICSVRFRKKMPAKKVVEAPDSGTSPPTAYPEGPPEEPEAPPGTPSEY
jgi:phospholipase C